MYHLIYSSHSSHPFTKEDLISLLTTSRIANKKTGITGILIYMQGKFIQVLEGDQQKVEAIYRKIQGDSRHKQIKKVMVGNSPERIFNDWSMGFKNLSELDFISLSGFKNIDSFFTFNLLNDQSSIVLVFLKLFYDKNLVDYPEMIQ
jgi:hypothetical protein